MRVLGAQASVVPGSWNRKVVSEREKLFAGLGQRFLKRLLARADLEAGGDSQQAITSPSIASGHLAGEGVRNIAALLAAARPGRRLADILPRLRSSSEGIPLSLSERCGTLQRRKREKDSIDPALHPDKALAVRTRQRLQIRFLLRRVGC